MTHAPAPKVDPSLASSLCVACGLCCNGVLHRRARLVPDEIPLAESLGMTILTHGPQPGFQLPCQCWQRGRCSVYAQQRPRTCGDYRCKLLRALDQQRVTPDQAHQTVAQARTLISEIEAELSTVPAACDPQQTIWQRIKAFAKAHRHLPDSAAFKRTFPTLALKISTLDWLLEGHFRAKSRAHSSPTRQD